MVQCGDVKTKFACPLCEILRASVVSNHAARSAAAVSLLGRPL
jgi:hypothetical protein